MKTTRYVALVVRTIDNGDGKVEYYCECMSYKDEAVVDAKLIELSRARMVSKSAPPYFYRRAEGKDHFDAVRKCIEEIEKVCKEQNINPDEIQGMYSLLPKEEEKPEGES